MNQQYINVSSKKPPPEAPVPVDPMPEPVQPEAPQQKDPVTPAVTHEVPEPKAPIEEPDPFDDGNFPV